MRKPILEQWRLNYIHNFTAAQLTSCAVIDVITIISARHINVFFLELHQDKEAFGITIIDSLECSTAMKCKTCEYDSARNA